MSANLEKPGSQDDSQAAASEKLINLIRENKKATRKQMAEALSVSTRTIQRLLEEPPKVHYVGSGYSGHWEITAGAALHDALLYYKMVCGIPKFRILKDGLPQQRK